MASSCACKIRSTHQAITYTYNYTGFMVFCMQKQLHTSIFFVDDYIVSYFIMSKDFHILTHIQDRMSVSDLWEFDCHVDFHLCIKSKRRDVKVKTKKAMASSITHGWPEAFKLFHSLIYIISKDPCHNLHHIMYFLV